METKRWSHDQITRLLRQHGIAPTHQRIEIARVLFSGKRHLSADQIRGALAEQDAKASKATVYNTLNLFRSKGLVGEVIVDPSRVFYDPETSPHHHLYDCETGCLTDIPYGGVNIVGIPDLPSGVEVERIDVIVRTRKARR